MTNTISVYIKEIDPGIACRHRSGDGRALLSELKTQVSAND
jgi:hypothetical protein